MNHGITRNFTEWGRPATSPFPCPSVTSVVDFRRGEAKPHQSPSVPTTMLKAENETYRIRGAIFEVYRELGSGFLEAVYQESLEREFQLQGIPYSRQVELRIRYKGVLLDQYFKADLICFDSIIVELKACRALDQVHRAQLLNYLKLTGMGVGLLVNFHGHPQVEIERIVL